MVTFNPSKSKLICGDYTPSSEFENLIYDGEGSSTETEQLVELNCVVYLLHNVTINATLEH